MPAPGRDVSPFSLKSAVEFIRSNPKLFFPSGVPTMERIVSMVMRDVTGISRIKADGT
jgi:hypothetical protein